MNNSKTSKPNQQANKKHKAGPGSRSEYPKKESILKLVPGMPLVVSFTGGRKVTGVLVGYDPLQNLVLDAVTELAPRSRQLGLVVCKGTAIESIVPGTKYESIANPFEQ